MNHVMAFLIILSYSKAHGSEFLKHVKSSAILAECDAAKGDERGPFGIELTEQGKEHSFLVMTGVYYETCKELESRVNEIKKKYKYLLLQGSESYEEDPHHIVWRWRSIKSPDGKVCISYFESDCK